MTETDPLQNWYWQSKFGFLFHLVPLVLGIMLVKRILHGHAEPALAFMDEIDERFS